jgi:benzoate-CoA ligase family protein
MPLDLPEHFNIAGWFVDRPAQAHPDRVAIHGEPVAVRYAELRDLVNRAGNALRASGCEAGDRVLILLPDGVEFFAAFFGAAKIGSIAVPVNYLARRRDLAYYLSDSGAGIAIVHASVLPEFGPAAEGKRLKLIVAGATDATASAINATTWDQWLKGESAMLETYSTTPADTAFFLFSSGSSGQPKAVIHQHKDMVATSRGFAHGVLGIGPEDRTFSVSKLFFAYGLGNGMYFPLSVGAGTILNPERTKVDRVAKLIAKHRPTIFFAVPTFFSAMLQEADRGLQFDFSSVRLVVSAGEPLPAEIFRQFQERYRLEILDGIGSTEMLQTFLSNRPGQARENSCGVPVPGFEVRVVGEDGRPLPADEIGTLWVKGDSSFAGYWNKPEITAGAKLGEWVVTGDKFYCDADGYYHYCGRADDMMKVSGMWVAPGEVENALLGHEDVAEAAVVGLTDGSGLICPVAYVVLKPSCEDSPSAETSIGNFLRSRLPSYKCPRVIHFVNELPKTATGKIQRYRLREQGDSGQPAR